MYKVGDIVVEHTGTYGYKIVQVLTNLYVLQQWIRGEVDTSGDWRLSHYYVENNYSHKLNGFKLKLKDLL